MVREHPSFSMRAPCLPLREDSPMHPQAACSPLRWRAGLMAIYL